MNSRKILRVKVDASRGVCEIVDTNGTVVATKDARTYYSDAEVKKRRADLKEKTRGRIPDEKLTFIDFLVYDILTEYDSEHQGAGYAKKYLDTVTDQIIYNSPASDEPLIDKLKRKLIGRTLETEATYLKRVREIKNKNLSKAGLSISYDEVEEIKASQALTSAQRQVAVDIAKRQEKYNGIKNGELVEIEQSPDDIPELSEEELKAQREAVEQERAKKAEEARKEEEAKKAEEARNTAKIQQSKPEAPKVDEKKDEDNSGDDDKKGPGGTVSGSKEAPKVEKQPEEPHVEPQPEVSQEEPRAEKPHRNQPAPKAKNKKRKIDKIRAGRKAYRERLQSGKVSKADRPYGAEAPKRETKNERKTRLAREAAERRKLNSSNPKVETPRVEVKNQKPEVKNTSKPDDKKASKKLLGLKRVNVEELKVRFTRKLNSIRDSIRNKVHKPTRRELKIAGVATLASLLLLAGVKGYEYFNNTEIRGVIADTTSVVQMLEGEKEIKNGEITVKPSTELSSTEESTQGIKTPTGMSAQVPGDDTYQVAASGGGATVKTETETTTRHETQTTDQVQAQEADASREYLSSIKLGSIMIIDKGAYFVTPEGTGDPGNFENYKDYDKKLSAIGITLKEGYIQIGENGVYLSPSMKEYFNEDFDLDKLKDMNLYELKQLFSDAKFSYHFGGEHKEDREKPEDEKRKTPLGWLTEKSFEQTIDTTRTQTQMEDRER